MCGHEKAQYIVVAYTADGTNLYVLLIFKMKSYPKKRLCKKFSSVFMIKDG